MFEYDEIDDTVYDKWGYETYMTLWLLLRIEIYQKT